MFRQTERQALNCYTATLLTLESARKRDLSNNKELWKSEHFSVNSFMLINKKFHHNKNLILSKCMSYKQLQKMAKTFLKIGDFAVFFTGNEIFLSSSSCLLTSMNEICKGLEIASSP